MTIRHGFHKEFGAVPVGPATYHVVNDFIDPESDGNKELIKAGLGGPVVTVRVTFADRDDKKALSRDMKLAEKHFAYINNVLKNSGFTLVPQTGSGHEHPKGRIDVNVREIKGVKMNVPQYYGHRPVYHIACDDEQDTVSAAETIVQLITACAKDIQNLPAAEDHPNHLSSLKQKITASSGRTTWKQLLDDIEEILGEDIDHQVGSLTNYIGNHCKNAGQNLNAAEMGALRQHIEEHYADTLMRDRLGVFINLSRSGPKLPIHEGQRRAGE